MAQVRNKKSAAAHASSAKAAPASATAKTVKEAAPVKATAKTVKAEQVKVEAKKTAPAKKAEKKPAATAKKTSSKKKTSTEVYVQFDGKEFTSSELIAQVKEIWTKEMGHKVSEATDMKVYVNANEGIAYYVINGDITGNFAL